MTQQEIFDVAGLQLTPALSIVYILASLSIIFRFVATRRIVAVASLCLAIAASWWTELMQPIAVGAVSTLVLAAFAYKNFGDNKAVNLISWILLIAGSLALALHLVPGFQSWKIIPDVQISDGALVYSKATNIDKLLVGAVLLIWCVPLAQADTSKSDNLKVGYVFGAAISLGFVIALMANLVAWQPKWHSIFTGWLLTNLLLSVVTEEVFFRGFLQSKLTRAIQGYPYYELISVAVIAILFGLAHIGGGVTYAVIATLFGFAYGYVYAKTQSISLAIGAHLLANSVHFTLFSYPVLV